MEKIGACPDAQAALDLHNAVRARRGAAPLLWSKTLADSAQAVADTCVFAHSNTNYGENLAIGTNMDCEYGTQLWVDEESLYDNLSEPGFSSATGHFSQVVWKNSLQVGCGYKVCSRGGYVVCHYYPYVWTLWGWRSHAPTLSFTRAPPSSTLLQFWELDRTVCRAGRRQRGDTAVRGA